MIEAQSTIGWVLFFMGIGVITLAAFLFWALMGSNKKGDDNG